MTSNIKTLMENLFYTEAGTGVPIIFIHGNLVTGMETFAPQMAFFSSFFRCICPDLRCHGKSISRCMLWTPENMSVDLIRMMDSLNIDKAHFVGHSMGGDIMMYIIRSHMERVITATSVCTGGDTNKSIITYMKRFDPDILDPVAHKDFICHIKQEHAKANHGDWKQFLRRTIWNCVNFPGFTDEELRRMDVPFQLIRAKRDKLVKDSEVERLRRLIPNFHLIEIDGSHSLTSDEKTAPIVNRYIYDFITRPDNQG